MNNDWIEVIRKLNSRLIVYILDENNRVPMRHRTAILEMMTEFLAAIQTHLLMAELDALEEKVVAPTIEDGEK